MTRPPDGTMLEDVIRDLQSQWGVPQYPQEYRLTIKVAEEKDQKVEVAADRTDPQDATTRTNGEGPVREKAPSVAALRGDAPERESAAPRKRRRRGRRRRGGGPKPAS